MRSLGLICQRVGLVALLAGIQGYALENPSDSIPFSKPATPAASSKTVELLPKLRRAQIVAITGLPIHLTGVILALSEMPELSRSDRPVWHRDGSFLAGLGLAAGGAMLSCVGASLSENAMRSTVKDYESTPVRAFSLTSLGSFLCAAVLSWSGERAKDQNLGYTLGAFSYAFLVGGELDGAYSAGDAFYYSCKAKRNARTLDRKLTVSPSVIMGKPGLMLGYSF